MNKKILAVASVLLLIVIIGVIIWLVGGNNSSTSEEADFGDMSSSSSDFEVVTTEDDKEDSGSGKTDIDNIDSSGTNIDGAGQSDLEDIEDINESTGSGEAGDDSNSEDDDSDKDDSDKNDQDKDDSDKDKSDKDDSDDVYVDENGSSDWQEVEYVEYSFRNNKRLEEHFEKHGKEMGFASAEEYEDAASDVVNNPKALHKTEKEDGDDVYYVESTNEFVIVSTDGYIRTYFNPSGGLDYYNRQ